MKHIFVKKSFYIFFILILAAFCAGNAFAEITVTGPVIDEQTGGDWRGIYGDCFFLLADPDAGNNEELVGPLWYSLDASQYAKACFGGDLFATGAIDWRVFIHDQLNGSLPISAFAWTGVPPYSSDPSAEQWNPCINSGNGGFKGTTFDDHIAALYDPLVMELKINNTGCLKLAYYFFDNFLYWEAAGGDLPICRTEDFKLIVNGAVLKTGSVSDFSSGKFVVFELSGLTGETSIRFEVQKSENDACSGEPYVDFIPGGNSHLSGVFVNCAREGCTPGFWKNSQHFRYWPAPYRPNTQFSAVFENAFPGKTLLWVLQNGGGGLNALGRHTVAALLNSRSDEINFGLPNADVIRLFNATYPSRNKAEYERLKDFFEGLNIQGCPF